MTISDFVVSQLCLLGWRELKRSGNGNRQVALGIVHVIHNRVMAGWNGGDWLKVIESWPLHSSNLIEELDFKSLPDLRDPDFCWLVPQVEKVYAGVLRDSVTSNPGVAFALPRADALGKRAMQPIQQSALFWADLNNISRKWFKENILDQREQHPILANATPVTFIG